MPARCQGAWASVAASLPPRPNGKPARSGKQCREHWVEHLDPSVNKSSLTEEERATVLRLDGEGLGPANIARQLGNGRTANRVKTWLGSCTASS